MHRECLDKWRAVSPHPGILTLLVVLILSDAMVGCELCKTQYKLISTPESSWASCWRNTRYTAAVTLDLTFFLAICVGLYLLCGYVADLSFTRVVANVSPFVFF